MTCERCLILEAALRGVRHAIDDGGDCWCAYFRVVHTPPDDAIPLRDGHTEECWTARAALASPPPHPVEGRFAWEGCCTAREPGLGYPCFHKPGHLDQGIPHATITGRQWPEPPPHDGEGT